MFFSIFEPPKRSWKSKVSPPLSNQEFLGPCPDDRAQNSVQDSLNQSSVQPNPTLVFSNIRFQLWPPQYRPKSQKTVPDGPPWKPRLLGLCPDDRVQNSVQDSLNESSVRPNPTLVFSKIRFQIRPPSTAPKPRPSSVVRLRLINYHRKSGKCLYGKKTIDFVTRREAKDASRISGGDIFSV